MNDFMAIELSGAGMRAQRMRMKIIAENLANTETIGPAGPYQRKDVVFRATPLQDFEGELHEAMGAGKMGAVSTIAVTEVRPDNAPPLEVYDPSNPQANAQGMVLKPNVNVIREMSDMMEASRSYEANLTAAKATQDMLMAATELIRR